MCLVLGISEFIGQGIQTVSKFESVVKHIQKYEQDIDAILQSIVAAKLLKLPNKPDKSDDLPGTLLCDIDRHCSFTLVTLHHLNLCSISVIFFV